MEYFDLLILRIYGYTDDTEIGTCYQYGKHVKKNIDIAKRYYHQAAKNGDHKAYSRLSEVSKAEGKLAESFYFKAKTFSLMKLWVYAIEAYEEAAALNDAASMYELGGIYQNDNIENNKIVVKRDYELSCRWLRKATHLRHPHALRALIFLSDLHQEATIVVAQMHELGEINNQVDIQAAIILYEKASLKGNHDATHRLGQLYEAGAPSLEINITKSYNYYLAAAKCKHEPSLIALERVTITFVNDDYRMTLADVYLTYFNNPMAALKLLKYLADKSNREAIAKINILITQEPDYAYQMGLFYSDGQLIAVSDWRCYNYFKLAACKNHVLALKALTDASGKGSPLALYYLAQVYAHQSKWDQAIDCYEQAANGNNQAAMLSLAQIYEENRKTTSRKIIKKDLSLQLKWLRKAAISGSKEALDSLIFKSEKEANIAKMVAELYENCEVCGGKSDFPTAMRFLKLASKLYDVDTSYRLGNIYELGFNEIAIDLKESFNYYYIGASRKHKNSLLAIERLVEILKDDQCKYTLGMLYLEQFNNELSALKCFISLAASGNINSLSRLKAIAKSNAITAIKIAELYVSDTANPLSHNNSFPYYAIAALNNDLTALKILEEAAASGNPHAQYSVGFDYWFAKNEIIKAINWCLLAANQQHQAADNFLKTTQFPLNCYLHIAKIYELGDTGIDKNIELAITFYEKAFALNDKDAAFKLGELYFSKLYSSSPSVENVFDKICHYFIAAAKMGRKEGLSILDGLVEEISPAMKVKMGNLYNDSSYKNVTLAEKWYKSAAEGGNPEATNQLKSLKTRTTTNGNTFFFESKATTVLVPKPIQSKTIKKQA